MAIVYVAKSKALQEWGADVGISKNLYKVGLTDDVTAIAKTLVDDAAHGQTDWKIIGKRDVPEIADETEMLERLAQRIKLVDPNYYPKLKGARCIFKLNPHDVETHMVFKQTMAGEQPKVKKATPADIGNYFIENALK
jgi:hypothetical protein